MTRRGLTLLLACVLAVGLTASAGVASVPYVALGAGPTYDTLGTVGAKPVIDIDGRQTYPTTGELQLTTVGVIPQLTLFEALRGWVDSGVAVVPRDVVYPPDRTKEQVDEDNAASMTLSQDSATSAALRQLGIPIATEVAVLNVQPDSPAEGELEPGDVLTSVDGAPVTTADALRRQVSSRTPGAPVTLDYRRGGTTGTVTLTTASSGGEAPRAVIGVEPQEQADYPFEVTINLRKVGGPSAGLMFALGIVDKLDPLDLTGGLEIAGTGEITPEGVVGPIGGIPQKLLGAQREGATVFLTPAANCAEALGSQPDGLRLVRVEDLSGAVAALQSLREGGPVPSCSDAS